VIPVSGKVKVRLSRSTIGRPKDQKATAWALGLRRLGRVVVHEDTPQIRGMIRKIRHLVQVEEMSESKEEAAPSKRGGSEA